jgi:hypothetical protein
MLFGLNGPPQWLTSATLAVGGKNDLASANGGNNNVSVLVNQSAGNTLTFADGDRWEAGSNPNFVYAVDIDGDGMIDLVTTNPNSSQISVLINVSTQAASASSSPASNGFGTTSTSGLGSGTTSAGTTSSSAGTTSSSAGTTSSLSGSTSTTTSTSSGF